MDGGAASITVSLTGNPNSGKTALFNHLTRARGMVANYPRVTVTPLASRLRHCGLTLRVVDLPGLYTLNGRLPEERAACEAIERDRPDVVVNVLDAANLRRSLFLSLQLLEMGRPCVFALNMCDEARGRGIIIDTAALAAALGGPVVETIAVIGAGTPEVLDAVMAVAGQPPSAPATPVHYPPALEAAIDRIAATVAELHPTSLGRQESRWLAVKLLEGDSALLEREGDHPALIALVRDLCAAMEREQGEECAAMIAHARFRWIDETLQQVERTTATPPPFAHLAQYLDRLLLHRWWSLPILAMLMWMMFQATFTLGAIPSGWISDAVQGTTGLVEDVLPPGRLHDLICNGILAGIGGTIVFLPNIVILFFFMAVLSETGYLARIAFLLDRAMRAFGLHGKAMIPLIMGFGCNATAVMATRTIETPRSRLIAILAAPYVSCSARLPVFVLFAGSFFDRWAGSVVFALYGLSMLVSLGAAVMFDRLIVAGEAESFTMELPPYRRPALAVLGYQVWDSALDFLRKVGGVIVIGAVAIWFLQQYPTVPESVSGQARFATTYLGRIAAAISPVLAPLGFGQTDTVAILTGLVAKETVVSTFAVLNAQEKGSDGLRQAISHSMSPATALAFMVFVLLYTPCLTTLAVIRRESGSWRWAGLSLAASLVIAWTLAFAASTIGGWILP
ncbi:Ferrous iron transport protein B [Rhodovastum atsumiense]|uniref:Ferrous iron transport protein B n=1 Tax=Rhodovastum atsumiense TaxID=504468 RepID=A0A5M6IJG8_9PROT|nr:ferrous iron transport protein B [Rhodovastum atsumiense]KAA5608017.1 ferrous iron transport protein B [Rhodovastum atsumiense]CAH2598660.1 Ferrous iron transport protein B [Rhodovastum atsumiense]